MNNPQDQQRRKLLVAGSAVTLASSMPRAAFAQSTYPNKPVRIVVAFAPGGGSDIIARLLAAKLTEKLGQSVIVENKPGAGGNLGAQSALTSPADGYTLLLAAASYTVNPAVYKLKFDPLSDMTPIAQLARGPFIVAVNKSVVANDMKQLVDLAKKQPGRLAYASAGNGSITHIVSEYFLDMAGIDMLHIPYKGTAQALTDTISNQTQLVFGTVASTLPFVKSGQLKALAVTTPKRLGVLPDVPTVSESGFKDYQVTNWHGLIAPKGLPRAIQLQLNKAINESLSSPAMAEGMQQDGLTAAGGTPEDFMALLTQEVGRWGAVAKKRNVKAE